MKISRRRLADYVKKLHQKACRTCSTIIFHHSTNQIIDFWRCRWRCCRQILNSRLSNFMLFPGYQHFYPNVCTFHDDCPVHFKSPSNLGRLHTLRFTRSLVLKRRIFVSRCLVSSNFFFQNIRHDSIQTKDTRHANSLGSDSMTERSCDSISPQLSRVTSFFFSPW